MRKIAFYSVATHLGGAERSLLDLVTRLREASDGRYEPWLLLPRGEGALVEALRSAQVPCGVVPMPRGLLELSRSGLLRAPARSLAAGARLLPETRAYLAKVSAELRREGAALIHTTGIKCHGLSVLAARGTGIPVLWHLRDILAPGPVYWMLRGLQRWGGVGLVANSRATADAFLPGSGTWGRVPVVHNGIDPARFARALDPAARARLRAELGARPDDCLIGIVGVLARWKGQLEFLQMARALLDAGVAASFVVVGGEIYDTVGDRGYGRELRKRAGELGLSERVHFTGHVADPAGMIQAMDIAVHASLRPEPFGRVLIEAMAIGTPLVAAGAGGVLEIAEDGHTALLFAPGDVPAMASAVRRLVESFDLRERLRARAREAFEQRFTVEQYVRGVIGVYDRLF